MARYQASRKPAAPPARSDAYVGLLGLSLVALIAATVLMYLDYSKYDQEYKPKLPSPPNYDAIVAAADGSGGPKGG